MTADNAPRDLIGTQQSLSEIIALAEKNIPPAAPAKDQTTSRPTGTRIRIHKDNLLIAKCEATGMGPGRLFVSIDPLHYPVNSKLTLEFVNNTSKGARALLTATVTARSLKGIELRLDPTPAA
jgi:hypothetical protein